MKVLTRSLIESPAMLSGIFGDDKQDDTREDEFEPAWSELVFRRTGATFRLVMEVLLPSILMMHFAVKSFSLQTINSGLSSAPGFQVINL